MKLKTNIERHFLKLTANLSTIWYPNTTPQAVTYNITNGYKRRGVDCHNSFADIACGSIASKIWADCTVMRK